MYVGIMFLQQDQDLMKSVHLPEFKVLKWSEEDLAKYGGRTRTIGAPLAEGESLFTEQFNKGFTCQLAM